MVINLSRTPTESYNNTHYFCDYIELLALVSNGDPTSKDDIFDKFCEDDRVRPSGDDNSYEINNNWETKFINWFSILKTREEIFSEFYPFIITNTTVSSNIKLKNEDEITDKHKLYIFLLLNSLQKYLNGTYCSILTSDFEEFSLKAFKEFLPTFGHIHRFGKSGLSFGRYTGHITDKIDKFADDLKYRTLYESRFFSSTDNGDGGLDIVSWVPFGTDNNFNNIQIYLGQCATGKNWLEKKDDTDKFHNFIHFKSDVKNVMFIPYDGRNDDRTFNQEAQMNKNLLLDRERLLSLLNTDLSDILLLSSFNQIVEPVINFEDDIL